MSTAAISHEDLRAQVNAYVDALVARDATRLRLAPGARFTENGQSIPMEDGLWGSASAKPAPQQAVCVTDTASGNAALFGTVSEHGAPCLFALRLALGPQGISEAETLVCRERHSLFSLFDPEGMTKDRSHFDEIVPVGSRADREGLISVANLYFDGIESDDGSRIPVTDDAIRFENGVQAVRQPSSEGGFGGGSRMKIAEQISSGMFRYIGKIRDRRYPVIDEERGLVMGIVFFDHPGKLTSVDVAGVGKVELPEFATRPSSALIFELFKVVDRKITAVEALLDFFPFGMGPNWPA